LTYVAVKRLLDTMTFRLQYASNLFVDSIYRPFKSVLKPAAPHLALLGNIGRPESPKTYHFLKFCASNWDSVFWVPGPHELSNVKTGRMTYKEKAKSAFAVTKQMKNIHLMASQEAVFHESRVVLIGTPLWTPLKMYAEGQPEFQGIYTSVDEAGPIPLCHHIRNQLHKEDLNYLKERSLFWNIIHPEVNLVYLTQSLPSSHLLGMPSNNQEWNRRALDCWQAPLDFAPRAWIGGASASTHRANLGADPQAQTVSAVNGLFSYPLSQYENPKYEPDCVLEIEPKKTSKKTSRNLPNLTLPPFLSSLLEKKVSLAYA